MDIPEPLQWSILGAAGLLGWLSGTYESALQEMSTSRLEDLLEEKSREKSWLLESILKNSQSFRLSCAFCSTLCYGIFLTMGMFFWVIPVAAKTPNLGISDTPFIHTVVLLLVTACLRGFAEATGEMLSEKYVYYLAMPLWILTLPLRWLGHVLLVAHRTMARLFGITVDKTQEELEDDVIAAVSDGELAGVVREEQREMIERVFDFHDSDVADIFTPRTEMDSIEVETPLADAITHSIECGHSRLPVHDKTRDNVVGVFYVRDALEYWQKENAPKLHDIMRKPLFVPETKNIVELLQQMRRSHTQIAIVLDEYGGTAGLVTIEDVLEEIVGDIHDEYDGDEEEYFIKSTGRDHVVADGLVHVSDINKALEEDLIPEDDDYETIGGFVLDNLGHIPKSGEEFLFQKLRVKIVGSDERRVKRVEIRREHSA